MSARQRKGGALPPKQEPKSAQENGKSHAGPEKVVSVSGLRAYHVLLVVLLGMALYANAIPGGFVYDDHEIQKSADVTGKNPWTHMWFNDFWAEAMSSKDSHKSYRPLTILTFRIDYMLWGLHAKPWHTVNMVLHGLVSGMLSIVVSDWLSFFPECSDWSTFVPFVSGLLFAAHPIHTEAVANIVGRAELLCAFFFLAALRSYLGTIRASRQGRRATMGTIASGVLLLIGAFCKEQGVTAAAVAFLLDLFMPAANQTTSDSSKRSVGKGGKVTSAGGSSANFGQRLTDAIFRVMPMGLAVLGVLGWRKAISGDNIVPWIPWMDNPHSTVKNPALRALNIMYVHAYDGWLLLAPITLRASYDFDTIPVMKTLSDPRIFIGPLFYTLIAALALYTLTKPGRPTMLALSLLVVTFIPASGLLAQVGFVVAERVLYLPSAGYCIYVAIVLHRLYKHQRAVTYILLAAILLGYGVRTVTRNVDWLSDKALWIAEMPINQNNFKVHSNYASEYLTQPGATKEQLIEGAEHFIIATGMCPDALNSIEGIVIAAKRLVGDFRDPMAAYKVLKNGYETMNEQWVARATNLAWSTEKIHSPDRHPNADNFKGNLNYVENRLKQEGKL